MARKQTVTFRCGHDGCKEFAHYEYTRRDEAKRLYNSYGDGKYRCGQHSRMEEILTPDCRLLSADLISKRCFTESGSDIGLFWNGGSGFASGPGFKAFTKDFPEGTVLRITAEVIFPTHAPLHPGLSKKAITEPNQTNDADSVVDFIE